ncbi:MAG: sulfatase-like hydrolase/transferase [Acidimicrobiia bacterium]|nr:sulfatase-like hydrolase/transferase [Acidimicrobiia bacterium]
MPGEPRKDPTPARRESRRARRTTPAATTRTGIRALHILGLSAFALAQPVFDLLGNQATFFVAHNTGPAQIVLFTVLLLIVPPAILIGLEGLVTLVSRTAGWITHLVLVGFLVGLTLVPPLADGLGFGSVIAVAVLLAFGAGAAYAYQRFAGVRSAATWLSAAPLIFGALFLFASPVNNLVFPDDAVAYAVETEQTPPVVWLSFDELPVASLLDAQGEIDAERFPNFARLAATSTWYPNATTVAGFTPDAIPAMLSGQLPEDQYVTPPTTSFHPDTIFSLLAGTYDLTSYEVITDLCSTEYCEQPVEARPSYSFGTLLRDTGTVFLHSALPDDAADRWLPTLEGRWAGFGQDVEGGTALPDVDATTTSSPTTGTAATGSAPETAPETAPGETTTSTGIVDLKSVVEGVFNAEQRLDSFLEGLGPSEDPSLWFFHANLPHEPWTYLPDGRRYNDIGLLTNTGDNRIWDKDELLIRLVRQRHFAQLEYADAQLGRVLDRLEETEMLEEALVVVTADHGLELRAGNWRRHMSPYFENQAGVLPVPMFVKQPGQTTGSVDERNAQTIDLLPTVADILGADIPFEVDGTSLLGSPDNAPKSKTFVGPEGPIDFPETIPDIGELSDVLLATSGTPQRPDDIYAIGEHRDFVHRSVSELDTGPPSGFRGELYEPETYAYIDTQGPFLPALVWGGLDSATAEPGREFALAVNGVVAGIGSSFQNESGLFFAGLVDPAHFRDGANDVEVFLIETDGTLRPVELTDG